MLCYFHLVFVQTFLQNACYTWPTLCQLVNTLKHFLMWKKKHTINMTINIHVQEKGYFDLCDTNKITGTQMRFRSQLIMLIYWFLSVQALVSTYNPQTNPTLNISVEKWGPQHCEIHTCGWFLLTSIRLSIVRTKAAVFPVPLCDCAIMFWGLKNKETWSETEKPLLNFLIPQK